MWQAKWSPRHWDSAGGGVSVLKARPSFQSGIATVVGKYRGVPDLSFDSNPVTGVWVYDSSVGGRNIVGGTSVASPALAGIINLPGNFYTSSNAELTAILRKAGSRSGFQRHFVRLRRTVCSLLSEQWLGFLHRRRLEQRKGRQIRGGLARAPIACRLNQNLSVEDQFAGGIA